METLDEVIHALEVCTSDYCSNHDGDCPYLGHYKCNEEQRNLDALHYLQEYKKLKRTAKVVHKQETHIVKPPKSTTIAYETETNLWDECGNCGAMGMYHGWNYCPVCGAKLDWGE